MFATSLKCAFCGCTHPLDPIYHCKKCGGTLDVDYDYEHAINSDPWREPDSAMHSGIWRYRALLPLGKGTDPVSLSEGGTPLMPADGLAKELNLPQLYLKNETLNPTLSFKDRPLSVALSVAKAFGMEAVVTASTGNTGVAAAAYAAKAGLPCSIYVPESTPKEKLNVMEAFGAQLKMVPGTFSDAYEIAGREAEEKGHFNLTSTYLNPYAYEGDKTVAYEIYQQLNGVPDWVIIPVGAGPLLYGCLKGFRELQMAGKIDRLPRMVGVQGAGCAPIVLAYETNAEEVEAWREKPNTIAGGIADPLSTYPQDGTRTLRAIRESKGMAVGLSDESIVKWARQLARTEGILAEASSATAIAALPEMIKGGHLNESSKVVCVITGHGIKDPSAIS